MAFGAPSLKGRALRYLAQREHSRAELERKLRRHVDRSLSGKGRRGDAGPEGEEGSESGEGEERGEERGVERGEAANAIAAALDELAAHGLLSDERAAASVLVSQAPRSGERRLKQTLQSKGLAPELIARSLAQVRGSEFERAQALWQRRFGAVPADAAERARQMRFLQARGFGFELIVRVLKTAGAPADDTVD